MPARSLVESPVRPVRILEAATLALDWPCERVGVQLEVVQRRRLTALEWVVEELLAWRDTGSASPTLEEAADELGLADPLFLRETLRSLLREELLEWIEAPPGLATEASSTRPADLAALLRNSGTAAPAKPALPPPLTGLDQLRFTERGRELFRLGLFEGLPARPGLELWFDVVTGQPLEREPVSPGLEPVSARPVIPAAALPPLRTGIGLDRVRQLVKRPPTRSQEDGEGEIRGAILQPERGGLRWEVVRVRVGRTADGQVELLVLDGQADRQADRQAWLHQQDLTAPPFADWIADLRFEPFPGETRTGKSRQGAQAASATTKRHGKRGGRRRAAAAHHREQGAGRPKIRRGGSGR